MFGVSRDSTVTLTGEGGPGVHGYDPGMFRVSTVTLTGRGGWGVGGSQASMDDPGMFHILPY